MKFSTRSDVDAPIGHVFDQVTDFASFERAAMRRGAKVRRVDTQDLRGPGMCWEASFPFRGKTREFQIDLEDYEAPTHLAAAAKSSGVSVFCDVELIELSPRKTRMRISIDVKPKTLSARVLVQSMKLAKGTIERRFSARVADYAKDLSEGYAKAARA
ncbi:SRPBCC family protein [Pseudooceanicola sp.]|uniref:SRPBCC family protein n=1 Tax=Pseudooceanicola sp. TaxID=1914328 RepID=UPI0035C6F71D